MNGMANISKLKAEIVDTKRLLELADGHPIMTASLGSKLKSLEKQLTEYSTENTEPEIRLLFSGNAVFGSKGVKSSVVSRTMKPVQELVKTEMSLVRFGKVAKRGRAKRTENSDLFLTAVSVGSFGFELSQLNREDLFDEVDISDAIKRIIELINSVSESDESFENAIDNTPKRNLSNLKKLFKVISDEDSFLKIESGSKSLLINKDKVKEAYHRAESTSDKVDELFLDVVLKGILLETGKFEAKELINNRVVSGFIDSGFDEETLVEYNKKYLNNECMLHLQVHKTIFKNGNEKTTFELLEITEKTS